MNKLFVESQKAIITLPARNDCETENFASFEFCAGVLDFGGQEFIFPNGLHVDSFAKWFDENLLLVRIAINGELQAECARCLKHVNLEISGELEYLYYLRGSDSESEDSMPDDYMPVEIKYFGRVLDIMSQVKESVYTLLPTKILCREDCAGLCPECGKDLNFGECSCVKENTDPRLETLKNFLVE